MATTEPDHFEVRTAEIHGVCVVAVSGELDMATAPELEGALQGTSSAQRIVLDLCEVTFIDSSGLNVLLSARQAAERVAIACPPGGPVARLFGVAAVDDVFDVHPDAAGAVEALRD